MGLEAGEEGREGGIVGEVFGGDLLLRHGVVRLLRDAGLRNGRIVGSGRLSRFTAQLHRRGMTQEECLVVGAYMQKFGVEVGYLIQVRGTWYLLQ